MSFWVPSVRVPTLVSSIRLCSALLLEYRPGGLTHSIRASQFLLLVVLHFARETDIYIHTLHGDKRRMDAWIAGFNSTVVPILVL